MNYNKLYKLLISIIICELAGVVGSVFTISQINKWYIHLNKPSFNPPNWIFGPVWTTLFVLMGISLYLVWQENKKKKKAIIIFAVQLLLNILWSIIFFGMHLPLAAFVEIAFLWGSIVWLVINLWSFSKLAKA